MTQTRPQMMQIIYDESGATSGAGIPVSELKSGIVIIAPVSSFIEEEGNIAVGNIQNFLDNARVDSVYEFFSRESGLKHKGTRKNDLSDFTLREIPAREIMLIGGSLEEEHLRAFSSVLEQMRKERKLPTIHIPLDCCYSYENKYESAGEDWTEGCLGRRDMPLGKYEKALKAHAPGAYLINVDGKVTASSAPTMLRFWSNWKDLAVYLKGRGE